MGAVQYGARPSDYARITYFVIDLSDPAVARAEFCSWAAI